MINPDRILTQACFSIKKENKFNLPAGLYCAKLTDSGLTYQIFDVIRNYKINLDISSKELATLVFSPALLEK